MFPFPTLPPPIMQTCRTLVAPEVIAGPNLIGGMRDEQV
jgi:hypothetical protein